MLSQWFVCKTKTKHFLEFSSHQEVAMDEVVVSPLMQLVSENISSLMGQESSLVLSIGKELEKLSSTISIIKEVVEVAEEKQTKNIAIKNWLDKLKYAAYDADDILDECATEALRLRVEGRGGRNDGSHQQVCNFFSPCRLCIKKVVFRFDIKHKIKKIRKKLQEIIAEERSGFHLEEIISKRREEENRRMASHEEDDESVVFGREAEKERIVELLLSSECDAGVAGVCVIPIVGCERIGKTTLVGYVLSDERVQEHFELRIWVHVQINFDNQGILIQIKESETGNYFELHEFISLRRFFLKTIKEKRYLLVLDEGLDVIEEYEELLRAVLGCGAPGSRIIVITTSKLSISSFMRTVDPIHLEGLSEEDCWSLFMKRALGDMDARRYPHVVALGKMMLRKCRGVPKNVKDLGDFLNQKKDEVEWFYMLHTRAPSTVEVIRGIQEYDRQYSVRIGYVVLPLYLKLCFLFCSMFPKEHKFEKDTLIKMWIAQGFIQPSKERSVQMEDVGCQYFEDLLCRHIFLDEEKDVDGNITSCSVGGSFRDLAESIAGKESQVIDLSTSTVIYDEARHSSWYYDRWVRTTTLQQLNECKKLRTILIFGEGGMIDESLDSLFLKFRRLRVLDLGSCDITKLPDSIGSLKHLRYLNISGNHCRALPESICSLWNLQTLKIQNCVSLSELPKGMGSLINLRHLEIDGDNQLTCMPTGIGKLTRLRTLSIFSVGKESGAGIGELQDLNLLQGNLEIINLENIRDIDDAKEARLNNKEYLRFLVLRWSDFYSVSWEDEQAVAEGVSEALQPHTNLERLCIEGYIGDKLPSWMGDSSFTNLVRVDLYNCRRSEHLPPLGRLNSLKHLTISEVHGVKHLNDEINGDGNLARFPSLEFLVLRKMPGLEELMRNGEGEMNSLLTLEIESCPKLRTFPQLPLLEFLELRYMPDLEWFRNCREMPSLQRLKIESSSKLMALPQLPMLQFLELRYIHDLEELVRNREGEMPRLYELIIENCPKLRLLPQFPSLRHLQILNHCKLMASREGLLHLTSLERLELSNCEEIAVTLEHHPSLKTLLISYCPHLTYLPDGLLQDLATLWSLEIRHCPKLTSLPERLDNLIALRSLSFIGCGELVSLPEIMQNISAIRGLCIDDSTNLPSSSSSIEALDRLAETTAMFITYKSGSLQYLIYASKLESLHIYNCPKLESLPEGLQYLDTLTNLEIKDCPLLEERCNREEGEDWYKISHVPNINIGHNRDR